MPAPVCPLKAHPLPCGRAVRSPFPVSHSLVNRYLKKLLMDPEGGIRVNTTVCLGRVAKHFDFPKLREVRRALPEAAVTHPLPPPLWPAARAGCCASAVE